MKKYTFLLLSLITNTVFCSEWTMGGQKIPSPTNIKYHKFIPISSSQNDTNADYSIGNHVFRRNSIESAGAAAIFYRNSK